MSLETLQIQKDVEPAPTPLSDEELSALSPVLQKNLRYPEPPVGEAHRKLMAQHVVYNTIVYDGLTGYVRDGGQFNVVD
jgi:hypothetical protein